MKVDYHIHLEEGPYSLSMVEKSMAAMEKFTPIREKKHTKEWFLGALQLMVKRFEQTEYSEWWLDFYLQQALERGITEVGIVDHLYRFVETKPYFERYMDIESPVIGKQQKDWLDKVMVRNLSDFVHCIEKAKVKWAAKGVSLKLGIEADYFVGGEEELAQYTTRYNFDYIIGSVHFHNGWGFDNPALQQEFERYELDHLYKAHFETVKAAASSGLFDFIAHLDNIKVFNYRPDESTLHSIYRDVAKTLKKHDVATEINPGLFYRYPVKEMCPSPTFLHILAQEGVAFTTSSDSHFPHDLGIYADDIQRLLQNEGITEIATFTKRKRIMLPLEGYVTV